MAERGMGEWAPLPTDLGREARALAEYCRLLKERTGLSLAALAERTHYSKSSWQRCLNGRQIPPRSALRSLAEAAEADPARLLALRESVLRSGRAPLPPPEPQRPGDVRRPPPEPQRPGDVRRPPPEDAAPAVPAVEDAPQERQAGEEFPEPTAPVVPLATTVRRWRLIAAALLVVLLAVISASVVLLDRGDDGCATVTTDP